MTKTRDSRASALAGAERLFRTQGYAATGLTEILEVSGAPKGSFYFHFPDGKLQLAREVLQAYGKRIEATLRVMAAKHEADPAGFVRSLCKGSAREMGAANWALGCAAQNLTNELASSDPALADVLAQIFAAWIAVIAEAIRPAYPSKAVAERRATALLAALEGARTLARANRSEAPFDAILDMALQELRLAKPGRA
jgi:TetR/AcrR family transcriptional repressor of lmrAB and yxaGH operons